MTLLDFARGPAMYWAMSLMVIGIVWRLSRSCSARTTQGPLDTPR